jgi:predicted chitinase
MEFKAKIQLSLRQKIELKAKNKLIMKYNSFILNAETAGNITSKRELAMFLAQIIWESGGLIYVQEIRCVSHGCPGDYETY